VVSIARELELRIIVDPFAPGDYYKEITVSGDEAAYGRALVQITTEETLTIPTDIATVGYVLFLYDDTDSDGYVEIGTATGAYDIKISLARPIAVLPWNGTTIYWKATDVTATAAVIWAVIEA